MTEGEVKVDKIQGPAGLTMVELLGCHEVLQVLVVCPYLYWICHSFEEIPLLFQNLDDSQYLLVIDLIVVLYWGQELAVKDHWVLFTIQQGLLRQDRLYGEVRAVGLNPKRV